MKCNMYLPTVQGAFTHPCPVVLTTPLAFSIPPASPFQCCPYPAQPLLRKLGAASLLVRPASLALHALCNAHPTRPTLPQTQCTDMPHPLPLPPGLPPSGLPITLLTLFDLHCPCCTNSAHCLLRSSQCLGSSSNGRTPCLKCGEVWDCSSDHQFNKPA